MKNSRYDILFEKVKIGPVTAPNRFYQVSHCNGMGHRFPHSLAKMQDIKTEIGRESMPEEYEDRTCNNLNPERQQAANANFAAWRISGSCE